MLARLQQRTLSSHAPTLSPSSSSPSSPMSPTSPELSPSPPAPQSLPALGMPVTLATSPSRSSRPHTIIPAPSIQKYSDALRRALSARFEAVAAAGANARPPPPDARFEDPDYGYDEDPFDTRAKLLLSLNDKHPLPQPHTESQPPLPPSPPPRSDPAAPALYEETSFFDLGSDTELETTSRRWSVASSLPSHAHANPETSWFDGASTPSSEISHFSEASFEVGRASDWISLYGRTRLRTPPVSSRRNSLSSLHGMNINTQMLTPSSTSLRPLTPITNKLTPSPQPSIRRFRRQHAHPYDLESKPSTPGSPYEPPVIARTTSETMILAAGLASQRERRRGIRVQ